MAMLSISMTFGTELSNNKIECPEGWMNGFDLGCFFFANETTNLSWFQSQYYCASIQDGAFLAEIDSAKTQEYIDIVVQDLGLKNNHWWLGGTDFFQEGVWRWERTASTFNYTNWGPNEPNNQNVEGCLELWTGTMEWNDYSCDGLKKYRQKPMCQKFV